MVDSDGTQAPEPPKPFSDSLGGSASEPRGDGTRVDVAQPTTVDREAVQELVNAALAAERGAGGGSRPEVDDEPTTEIPPQSQRSRPRPLAIPMLRLRRRTGNAPPRPKRPVTVRKPSSGSAGMAVALVLLVIFIVIAIQFVASFVESVTGIFT